VRGAIDARLNEIGVESTVEPERRRLEELFSRSDETAAAFKKRFATFESDAASAVAVVHTEREKFSTDAGEAVSKANQAWSNLKAHHQAEMGRIEASFREEIKLRGPRQYWADKKRRHQIVGWTWLTAFLIGCLASLVVLYLFGSAVVDRVSRLGSGVQAADWLLLAVPAIIVLWVLRLFHRQATTNLTLMTDADERVTMVETYLALQAEGKIEEVERPLVLQPLFRPNDATGDDGVAKSLVDHAIDALSKK